MPKREHVLKCWPEPFAATMEGEKRFEFRRDDRGFSVGDVLVLECWDPHRKQYAVPGGRLRMVVTYILRGQFGVPPDHVVMSIVPE